MRMASGKSCSRCRNAANLCNSALLARYLEAMPQELSSRVTAIQLLPSSLKSLLGFRMEKDAGRMPPT